MLPKPIQNLIDEFAKLPSVGPRQAARFVFHLLNQPKEEIEKFGKKFFVLNKIRYCEFCNRAIEITSGKLCDICKDKNRERSTICIVEKDTDIESLEKTKRYNGIYYVLGIEDEKKQLANLKKLIERIKKSPSRHSTELGRGPSSGQAKKDLKEIIIATDATTEGETIALYSARQLEELKKIYPGLKITRLGRGLSTGSELEYMDEDTLTNALLGRK
jgi:recombination protein RecR